VTEVQGNSTGRFNISVMCLEQANIRENGSTKVQEAQIPKTFVVIKDGNLHHPTFDVYVTKEKFDLLMECGLIPQGTVYSQNEGYSINLSGLPLFSAAWANPTSMRLAERLKQEAELEAKYTIVNARFNELGGPDALDKALAGSGKSLGYTRSKKELDTDKKQDIYFAPFCTYELVKYKVDTTAFEKEVAKMKDIVKVHELRNEMNKQKVRVRMRITACRMALEMVAKRDSERGAGLLPWKEEKTLKPSKEAPQGKKKYVAKYGDVNIARTLWEGQLAISIDNTPQQPQVAQAQPAQQGVAVSAE
jgi:hypothetical protein